MHVPGQPEDFAGRQRRPPAEEHDKAESGATALMEGVGATAYGRKQATAPGEPPGGRIARWAAAAKPSCHFISGTGSKGRWPLPQEGSAGIRSYVLTYPV